MADTEVETHDEVVSGDKLSGPEKLKLESQYLRGQILADLADGTDHVSARGARPC